MDISTIRNVAIIAHVDHGKTTLIDALLKQSGAFHEKESTEDRMMDSNDIERERGITILAKNTAVEKDGYIFNLVDTPGHADFGGEVERVLGMVDGVVLLVDAAEGPMPQTKFVLGKALKLGLKPILVVNKIDRGDARPEEVVDEAFDLFDALGATEEQLDFPVLYGVGRDGWLAEDYNAGGGNCEPLFDLLKNHVPAPTADVDAPFSLCGVIVERDPYVGRIITGRVHSGTVKVGQTIKVMDPESNKLEDARVTKLLAFRNLKRQGVEEAIAGDIVAIAGSSKGGVGSTICDPSVDISLPTQPIDPPTLAMTFAVNDSPLCGQEGEKLTSREIQDRLNAEAEINVSVRVEQGDTAESYRVMGRGELQLAVLIENMRREGFELSISRPKVIFKEENGQKLEPFEECVVDVDPEHSGAVMEKMGLRKAELQEMIPDVGGKQRLIFTAPTRSMIGYHSEFLTDTRGTGLMSRQFKEYRPVTSVPSTRRQGVLVSMMSGDAVPYALWNIEERGLLFIPANVKVYDGMIIGEHARPGDLEVNPTKAKQLTNVRASGKDDAVKLTPPRELTLEQCLTYIDDDELLEITPKTIRMRKIGLDANARKKMLREKQAMTA